MTKFINRNLSRTNLAAIAIVFFIILVLAIASVLAILYARGEKPTTNGLIRTGNIRINSDLNNLIVKVDGKEKKLDGKLVTNLAAGEYKVEISKNGYRTWTKTLNIEENLVKEIYINLIPENLKSSKLSSNPINKVFFSPKNDYVYFVVTQAKKTQDNGIYRKKIGSGTFDFLGNNGDASKILNIETSIKTIVSSGDYELIPSPDNNKLILQINKPEQKSYILDATKSQKLDKLTPLEDTITFPFTKLQWLSDSRSIVLESSDLISEYDLKDQQTRLISYTPDESIVYSVADGKVYFFDAQTNKIKYFQSHQVNELKLENIILQTPITHLYSNDKDGQFVYYQSAKGDFYFLDTETSYQQIIPSVTEFVAISEDGMSAIFKDKKGTFYSFVVEDKKSLHQFAPVLYQLPEDISELGVVNNIEFIFEDHNLLFSNDKGQLFISDLDWQNPHIVLTDTSMLAAIADSNSEGVKIFYLAKNNNPKDTTHYLYETSLRLE